MNTTQFSKEHLSAVLDAFIRVKNGEIDNSSLGICHNADWLSPHDAYSVVLEFSIGWDRHSGNRLYPVPRVQNYDGKWTGTQGALRYELLDYLIDKLTKVIGECDD